MDIDFLTQSGRALFGIRVGCAPEQVAAVKGAIREEMTRLSDEPIPLEERQMAIRLAAAAYAFSNQTPAHCATTLAFYEALGGYREAENYLLRLRRARRRGFLAGGRLVCRRAHLDCSVSEGEQAMRRLLIALGLLVISLPAASAQTREVLPNGLRVLVLPNSSTDVVAASLLVAIPVSADPPEQAGLRYLTHRLLLRGTNGESGDEMGRRLAAVGGRVGINCTLDYVEIAVQAPAEGFDVRAGLAFSRGEGPRVRGAGLRPREEHAGLVVRASQEDPFTAGYQALREELYGDDGYGRWTLGETDGLSSLTRDDCLAFYQAYYRPERAVLAIAGGLDAATARKLARLRLADWKPLGEPARVVKPEAAPPLTSSQIVARTREIPSGCIYSSAFRRPRPPLSSTTRSR